MVRCFVDHRFSFLLWDSTSGLVPVNGKGPPGSQAAEGAVLARVFWWPLETTIPAAGCACRATLQPHVLRRVGSLGVKVFTSEQPDIF